MAYSTAPSIKQQDGLILVAVLSITVFLGLIMVGIFGLAGSNLSRAHNRVLLLEAQYAAESGADAAIATLNSGNTAYTGTSSDTSVLSATNYKATYSVTVVNGVDAKERVITSTGKVYFPSSSATPTQTRMIRVTSQRSSTTSASSVISRNILAIDSGVKNVTAKDIYVNGFIVTNKNTTNLIAENITVAGKDTGATNCSIEGTGNLVKPSSFSVAGQTKTNITTAYNNCISPPGNTTNANFNVLANQGNVSTVLSTYIPWSQYMDNSYSNAAGGCNDWTTGASPRSIPSTGNTKKTHYPDTSSGVSASCGTSGDLSLGSIQYNISDNVHIRANLCATTACSPIFYNTSATTLRFIFVEGDINFNSVQTAAGSGPIAFVVYGSDPASNTGVCPYGGAMYLGNSGTTSAAQLYFLAVNGICLDKTKFSTAPALGGIGGKSIYVSTNPGSPFDLALNPTFPTASIPIDLSWRAIRYQRL